VSCRTGLGIEIDQGTGHCQHREVRRRARAHLERHGAAKLPNRADAETDQRAEHDGRDRCGAGVPRQHVLHRSPGSIAAVATA
jgi:hypothetical protein